MSISYSSLRSEVWHLYWRTWRQRLWKFHAIVFVLTFALAANGIYGGVPKSPVGWVVVAALGALPLIGFTAFPMIKFKPQRRILTVDDDGIKTTIGKMHADIPWHDILAVRDEPDALVIQRRNLNAFVVPGRAFRSAEEEANFRDFVRTRVAAEDHAPTRT